MLWERENTEKMKSLRKQGAIAHSVGGDIFQSQSKAHLSFPWELTIVENRLGTKELPRNFTHILSVCARYKYRIGPAGVRAP